jgi:hypothetical protein
MALALSFFLENPQDGDSLTITLTTVGNTWTETGRASKIFEAKSGVWSRAVNIVDMNGPDGKSKIGQLHLSFRTPPRALQSCVLAQLEVDEGGLLCHVHFILEYFYERIPRWNNRTKQICDAICV